MADRSAPAASADSLLASSGPKIFISYRTYEHAEYVEPLAATLSSSGFTVLLDRQKNLEDYRFGNLDLPLSGGLALGLRDLLRAADVAVVLVSSAARQKSGRQKLKEALDLFLLTLAYEGNSFTPGVLYVFVARWEKHWYEIETTKRLDESWQAWEQRVTHAIRVPVVFVAIPDGLANVAIGEARHDGAVVLEHAHLQEQVKTLLAPRLRDLARSRTPLERSPEKEQKYRALRRALIVAVVLLAPFIALAALLEWMTAPFRALWEHVRRAAGRLRGCRGLRG
jgi:hypothetical protein